MQSKHVAVAGIVAGAVMTGLGVVVLLAGLAGAERPDRDPVSGYEDVENSYPDVNPLPSSPGSQASDEPSDGSSPRSGSVVDGDGGATYEPAEPGRSATAGPDRPTASRETDEPRESGGSTPTSGPTRTSEPEPSTEPTDPGDPTTEPTPTETPTVTPEPQGFVQVGY